MGMCGKGFLGSQVGWRSPGGRRWTAGGAREGYHGPMTAAAKASGGQHKGPGGNAAGPIALG